MEMTSRRLASTISFFACRASRSPFPTMCTILRNSPISRPVSVASVWICVRKSLIRSLSWATKFFQPFSARFETRFEPSWIELRALVLALRALARDTTQLGEPHQLAFVSEESLVDLVEVLDQRIDARLAETERLHLGEDVSLKFLRLALLRWRQPLVFQLTLNVEFLQAAEPLEVIRDAIEGLEHLRFELRFHSADRKPLLHVVFVDVAFPDNLVPCWRSVVNWFADRTVLRG